MARSILIAAVFCAIFTSLPAVFAEDGPDGEDEEIRLLRQQLQTGERYERINAARSLGNIRNEAAFNVLVQALTTDDDDLRMAVISAVASFMNAEAAEALNGIFTDCDSNLKLYIIRQLSNFEKVGETEVFLKALKDRKIKQVKIKMEAVKNLNKRRDQEEVLEAFLDIMESKGNHDIKTEIVGGVPLRPEDANEMKILEKGLTDRSHQKIVSKALGRLLEMEMEPAEKLDLAMLASNSQYPLVRGKLADVLAKVATPEAADNLLKMLRAERNPSTSKKICASLGTIGGEAAAKGLADYVLHRDLKIRLAAIQALGNIQNDVSKKALSKSLVSDDKTILIAAVKGLAKFKSPDIISTLKKVSRKEVPTEVHIEVIKTLAEIDDPTSISVLTRYLTSSGEMGVRTEAVKALGQMKATEAAKTISRAINANLNNPDRAASIFLLNAIEALARIGGPEAEKGLIALSRSSVNEVRNSALSRLGEFNSKSALQTLVKACSDKNAQVRYTALEAIRKSLHPNLVDAVVELLEDPEQDICLLAIETLEDYAVPRTAAHLARQYEDEELHEAAVKALSKIDSKDSEQYLLEALSHGNNHVRLNALTGLSLPWAQGNRNVATKLADFLEQETGTELRHAAIAALGNTGTDEAIAKLEEICGGRNEPDTIAAVKALGKTGIERSTDFLITLAQTARYEVKMEAILALGDIGDEKAVPTLAKLMEEHDFTIKIRTAETLVRFDTAEAKQALLDSLDSKSTTVTGAIVRVLSRHSADPEVMGAVLKLMESDKTEIRNVVVEFLPLYATHGVVPILLAHLKDDPSKDVQAKCLQSLRRLMNREIDGDVEDWNKWWMIKRDRPVKEIVDAGFAERDYEISDDANKKTVEEYLRALTDENDYIRHNAIIRLRKITGQQFGYDPETQKNKKALDKWDQWWLENQRKFK